MIFVIIIAISACKSKPDYAYTTPPPSQSNVSNLYKRGDIVYLKPDSLKAVIWETNGESSYYVYWHNKLGEREEGRVYPEFIF